MWAHQNKQRESETGREGEGEGEERGMERREREKKRCIDSFTHRESEASVGSECTTEDSIRSEQVRQCCS